MRIPSTVLVLLLIAATAAPAQERRSLFQFVRADPVVASSTERETTVKFGPVQMSFPGVWNFEPKGSIGRGVGPSDEHIFVSILPFAPEEGVEQSFAAVTKNAKRAMQEQAEAMCGRDQPIQLVELNLSSDRVIEIGSCEGPSSTSSLSHLVQYFVYSKRGVIQVLIGGKGSVESARNLLDNSVFNHVWIET
jgi:hypothetical protein